MELNKEILLDCVNYISNYKFISIDNYFFLGDTDTILVTVTSYNEDLNYLSKKTVEIYIDEYNSYERIFKLKKIMN